MLVPYEYGGNMKSDSTFVANKNISLHEISGDKYVLANCETGDVYEINDTTMIIWEKLNKGLSPNEITMQLKEIALNCENILKEDILSIVSFFIDNSLIHEDNHFR